MTGIGQIGRTNLLRSVGLLAFAAAVAAGPFSAPAQAESALLNVSYDPTRDLYRDINAAFAEDWKAKTGEVVTVRASHGGSGAQARTVIDGVDADVVTLGIPSDIDAIARLTKKIPADWRERQPNQGLPYTSTVVFLVRKGNPKGVKDWDDLVKPDVKVITPNPKTSAGGRWNFLDTGARGSTITFAQRGLGDVLPTWENEAYLVFEEFGRDKFDVVVPPTSINAEPPVALVDANVDRKGTRKQAEAYLAFLYTDKAQAIFAKHHYRPLKRAAAAPADLALLPDVKLFKIEDLQGNWDEIQKKNFDNGGLFDQLSRAGR